MPLDKHNLIMAEAMDLIFHCLASLRPERYLLAYHRTYNAFFMDLPVSSFVSHSSLMTAKSVDLGVARWLPIITEIIRIVHSGYYDCRGAFQTVLDLYCCVTG